MIKNCKTCLKGERKGISIMEDKKELKKVFIRSKHIYMYQDKKSESIYTAERNGLETLHNCRCVIGNFLNFNGMSELGDKLGEAAREIKEDSKFPITISESIMIENGDTKNYYEVVATISIF
jgi:hypothetical protein